MNKIDPLHEYLEKYEAYRNVTTLCGQLETLLEQKDVLVPAAFNLRSHTLLSLIRRQYPEYAGTEEVAMEGLGDTIMQILEALWNQLLKALDWLRKRASDVWTLLMSIFRKNDATISSQLKIIQNISSDQNYLSSLDTVMAEAGVNFGTKIDPGQMQQLKAALAKLLEDNGYHSANAYILVNRANVLINPADVINDALPLAPTKILKDTGIRQAITTTDTTSSTNIPEDLARVYENDQRWGAYILAMIPLVTDYLNCIKNKKPVPTTIDVSGTATAALTKDMIKKGNYWFGRMGLGNSCLSVMEQSGVCVVANSRTNTKFSEMQGRPSKRIAPMPLAQVDALYLKLGEILTNSNAMQSTINSELEDLGQLAKAVKDGANALDDETKRNVLTGTRAFKELMDSNVRRTRDFGNLYGMLEKLLVGIVGEPMAQ